LEGIKSYLEEHYPRYAQAAVRRIYDTIRSLKTSPSRGRAGRREGTRELGLTPLPYIVVYWIKGEAVEILHIYHGTQDWRQATREASGRIGQRMR